MRITDKDDNDSDALNDSNLDILNLYEEPEKSFIFFCSHLQKWKLLCHFRTFVDVGVG